MTVSIETAHFLPDSPQFAPNPTSSYTVITLVPKHLFFVLFKDDCHMTFVSRDLRIMWHERSLIELFDVFESA